MKTVQDNKKMISEKSYKVVTKRKNGSTRVQYFNEDPSLTDRSQGEATDINNIMRRFQKDGYLPLSNRQGVYADMSEVPTSLTDAYAVIKTAEDNFAKLPSNIREKFRNNPQEMISFLQNPKNLAEAEKLGLVNRVMQNNDDLNDDKKADTVKQKSSKKTEASQNSDPE